MMRSLSSCLDATRMWRRTERANLEKKPSIRFSQEPCVGVKVNSKRPTGRVATSFSFFRDVRRMIVEDQLDRALCRIGGIQQLEELYEPSTAVTVFDERMDLPGEQI